jgi:hypothetical protein
VLARHLGHQCARVGIRGSERVVLAAGCVPFRALAHSGGYQRVGEGGGVLFGALVGGGRHSHAKLGGMTTMPHVVSGTQWGMVHWKKMNKNEEIESRGRTS